MGGVDPTYPLYPVACVLASTVLLLVLTTSFVRHSWNLGVTFLCFWLFWENLANAVSAVVWSDNSDIKLYVYCDIVSHLQVITFVVKPMATLIIARRLYLIASLQSVELPSKAARRWDIAVEWTLGLFIPILVAGPIYYINQGSRFVIYEASGCASISTLSILELLIEETWIILPPLVSVLFYYPKMARTYYRQRRDINSFLRSSPSVSHTNYFRILALASIDILLTLPIGIVNFTLAISYALSSPGRIPFYLGWTYLHTDWAPVSISYAELQTFATSQLAGQRFIQWTSPVLAFAIFGLFGATAEARASYWRIICTVSGWFGWKPTPRARDERTALGEIEFGARPQDTSTFDLERGSRPPSFDDADIVVVNKSAGHAEDGKAMLEVEEGPDLVDKSGWEASSYK